MSSGLDHEQGQHSVSPDLGQNLLERLSGDDKTRQFSYMMLRTNVQGCLNLCMLCDFKSTSSTDVFYVFCGEKKSSRSAIRVSISFRFRSGPYFVGPYIAKFLNSREFI